MKKTLLLSVFLFSMSKWLLAQAIPLTGIKVTSATAGHGGYYIISELEREVNQSQVIHTYTTPQLVYLDAGLRPQWSVDFAEYRLRTMSHVQVVGEQVYVSGTQYLADGERGVGWLVAFDRQGQMLWEKKQSLPGYHTVEGQGIYAGPDGDILWTAHIFRNYNSFEHPFIARLSAQDGTERWRQTPFATNSMATFHRLALTSEGKIAITGSLCTGESDCGDGLAPGTVYLLDPSTGRTLWNRNIRFGGYTGWNALLPTADGGLLLAGQAGSSVNGPQPMLAQIDAEGNLVRKVELSQAAGGRLFGLYLSPDGGLLALGQQLTNWGYSEPPKSMVIGLDQDLRVRGQHVGSQADGWGTAQGEDGTLVYFSREQLEVMPQSFAATAPTRPVFSPSASRPTQGVGQPKPWNGW